MATAKTNTETRKRIKAMTRENKLVKVVVTSRDCDHNRRFPVEVHGTRGVTYETWTLERIRQAISENVPIEEPTEAET